jgi:hypothetical protein
MTRDPILRLYILALAVVAWAAIIGVGLSALAVEMGLY